MLRGPLRSYFLSMRVLAYIIAFLAALVLIGALALIGYGLYLPPIQELAATQTVPANQHRTWALVSDLSSYQTGYHLENSRLFAPETLWLEWSTREGRSEVRRSWVLTVKQLVPDTTEIHLTETTLRNSPLGRIRARLMQDDAREHLSEVLKAVSVRLAAQAHSARQDAMAEATSE